MPSAAVNAVRTSALKAFLATYTPTICIVALITCCMYTHIRYFCATWGGIRVVGTTTYRQCVVYDTFLEQKAPPPV